MSARQGKIARLPQKIREELNQRLLDGESGKKILPWLNSLPRVREILGEDFEGLAVSDQNLSDWRNGGFADWVKQRGRIDRTRELARYAAEQSKANGATIADGAAAIASGQLLELLEAVDEAVEGAAEDGGSKVEDGGKLSPDALLKIAAAVSSLRTTEQNDQKLKLLGKRVQQREREVVLEEQKFQRSTCELFLKWQADQRALDVANGSSDNSEKIERLGQLMFGDTWKQAGPVPIK